MKYKVLLADDELSAIDLISELLKSNPNYNIVAKVTKGADILPSIIKYQPDLILLDINLGNHNGIELAKAIREVSETQIIFITAYNQFALDAFECKACDYLLKPVSISKFTKALKHFEEHIQAINQQENISEKRLRFNTQKGFILIKPSDILCLEADQAYTLIRTADNRLHHVSQNIGKIETLLDSISFVRSSRSSIINLNYLKEVCRTKNSCLVGVNGDVYEVKLSKSGFDKLESVF